MRVFHRQHRVDLPDDASHRVDDLFQDPVLLCQLLDQLVVLIQRGPVRLASLLLQLRLDVPVVFQRDQTLDLKKQSVRGKGGTEGSGLNLVFNLIRQKLWVGSLKPIFEKLSFFWARR